MTEFAPWPKIARLNRPVVVTEKIDGTNAAILIEPVRSDLEMPPSFWSDHKDGYDDEDKAMWLIDRTAAFSYVDGFLVSAQSRRRLIEPGSDNFGFAAWVQRHAVDIVRALGPGRHFGEWWGSGIQRGYDQPKGVKHFSLFNTDRYRGVEVDFGDDGSTLTTVPVLYHGPFLEGAIDDAITILRIAGSALPQAFGFDRPEGVVVFHTAANQMFKVTLEGDEAPKGPAGHAGDEG